MKTMRGFTLIELMIVVAIIGILAAWGVPGLQELAANNRQVATANMFVTTFQHARSQAITRSEAISINAIGGDWSNGWTIDTSGGESLSSHEALAPQFQVAAQATTYTFTAQGRLNINGSQTIDLCDERTGETGRSIMLEPIGRVSVSPYLCDQ